MVATHFSGNAIKIGVLENFEKPVFFGKKWWNYFLPVLKAPHFLGVTFFFGLFFFFFFLFLLHLVEGCAKNPIFIGFFFAHPAKASSDIIQQQWKTLTAPKNRCTNFIFGNPFLTIFFRNTNFAPPPDNCAPKNLKNPIFIGSKKDGQVINSTMAKLLTQKWPKNGQVINPTAYIYIHIYLYIYIYTHTYIYGWCLVFWLPWGNFLLKIGEKVHFTTKKAWLILVVFTSLLFPLFLRFQQGKSVVRKRGLRHIYSVCIYLYPCIYIYILYIYIERVVKLLSGPSLASLDVNYLGQVCLKKHGLSKKHYKNRGARNELQSQVFGGIVQNALKPLAAPKNRCLVAPSTGWMLYYLCFSPSTAIGLPLL